VDCERGGCQMASLQHRGSSKSPVNEINLSQPICRVGVTLVGPSAVYARTRCVRQTIYLASLARPCGPRDTIIWWHSEVHPARPLDEGAPSFSATWRFDHAIRQVGVKKISRVRSSGIFSIRLTSRLIAAGRT
jgi:hypothetical protein